MPVKQVYLISIFLLAAAGCSVKNESGLVMAAMRAQEECWNNGDIPGFMEYYWKSDSLKFIGSKGITYGWEQTLNNYIKHYPDKETMGKLSFGIIGLSQLSDKSMFMVGRWQLEREKPVGGYFSLLWKKIDGKWVIVCDHTS